MSDFEVKVTNLDRKKIMLTFLEAKCDSGELHCPAIAPIDNGKNVHMSIY